MESKSTEVHKKMKMKADHELPLCLIESDILPRLPAKFVGRFKCVCKRWNLFLSTPTFARMHLHHVNILNDRKLLVLESGPPMVRFHTLPLPEGSTTFHCNPNPNPNPDPSAGFIVASLDGLVCLASREVPTKLAFWNPLTGDYKKLSIDPDIRLFYSRIYEDVGFYIDSSNDYKLLYLFHVGEFGAYIYSNRLDSWRQIDFLVENACGYTKDRYHWCSHATFCGQSLYFTVKSRSKRSWILRFDVETEKFREIQFPPVPGGATDYCGRLVVLDGCIHLCVAYKIKTNTIHGDQWRMDGDGWVKVAAFPGAPYDELRRQHICTPTNGNWLAVLEENNSFKRMHIEDFATHHEIFDYLSWGYRSSKTIYVETLVSPNR